MHMHRFYSGYPLLGETRTYYYWPIKAHQSLQPSTISLQVQSNFYVLSEYIPRLKEESDPSYIQVTPIINLIKDMSPAGGTKLQN